MAIANLLVTIVGILPPIAAALTIAWYCVLLYDRFKKRSSKDD